MKHPALNKRSYAIGINRRVRCHLAFLFLVTCSSTFAQEFHKGSAFDRALSEQLTVSLADKKVRSLLDSFGAQRRIAVVLDRRINPDQIISVSIRNAPVRDALAQVAEKCGGAVSELPGLVFIGPPGSTEKLRTLVKLKSKPVSKFANRKELQKKVPVRWPALTEPKQLLTSTATTLGLEVANADLIEHDLWASGTIPEADAAMHLSVLLIQFGYTFEWEDNGRRIRIVPEPTTVSMDGRVRIKRGAPDNLAESVREIFPNAKVKKSGSYLKVTGTDEAIETARRLASGEKVVQVKPEPIDLLNSPPFKLAEFKGPAREVLKTFVDSGIPIDFDEAALKAAGVDLDGVVEFKLEGATIKEIFRVLSGQIGADFKVEKSRVRLFPK